MSLPFQMVRKPAIAGAFYKRLMDILTTENVTFDKAVLAQLVERYFPDWRRVLNECQRYSVSGTIDAGVLVNLGDTMLNL